MICQNRASLSIMLISLMIILLCACGSGQNDPGSEAVNNTTNTGDSGGDNGDGSGDGDDGNTHPTDAGYMGYVGIPDPTGRLPAAIYGTDEWPPSQTNTIPGFPADYAQIVAPAQSGGANEIVFNPGDNIGDAVYGPGTILFINGTNSSNFDYDIDNSNVEITFNCTAAEPCWIVGINNPLMGGQWLIDGDHWIVTDMRFADNNRDNRSGSLYVGEGSEYFAVRNSKFTGDGNRKGNGGSGLRCDGDVNNLSQFGIFYNNEISDFGDHTTKDPDYHGSQINFGCRYIWYVKNIVQRNQGNGLQVANSNADDPLEIPNYIFVAGNLFTQNSENGLASKNSAAFIASQNEISYAGAGNNYEGSPAVCLILSIDGEGDWGDVHVAFGNNIHHCDDGIRAASNHDGERHYTISNVVTNSTDYGYLTENHGDNIDHYVLYNTFVDCNDGGIGTSSQPADNTQIFHYLGNICVGGTTSYTAKSQAVFATLEDSIYFDSEPPEDFNQVVNVQQLDPQLDADLKPASCYGTSRHAALDDLQSMFGLDFSYTADGQARESYCAGAF